MKLLAACLINVSLLFPLASATVFSLTVAPSGDRVWNWDKSSSYVYTWWTDDANPNVVTHNYDYDNRSGYYADTTLSFDLTSISFPAEDVISATLNFDVLGVWTNGRDDIGTLSTGGTVYASGGVGLRSLNVTDAVKGWLTYDSRTADFRLNHTGFAGFSFGSAEGGDPAVLRITTAGSVPESSSSLWLLGSSLVGLVWVGRRAKMNRLDSNL